MSKDENRTSPKLSAGFQEVEAQREAAIEGKRIDEENKELVVYFHVARKGQLGGRSVGTQLVGGKEVTRDNPLRFDENIYVTSDPAEIAFIEGHNSFGIHCYRCADMNDANQRRAAQQATKQDRNVTVDLEIRADGRDIITAE